MFVVLGFAWRKEKGNGSIARGRSNPDDLVRVRQRNVVNLPRRAIVFTVIMTEIVGGDLHIEECILDWYPVAGDRRMDHGRRVAGGCGIAARRPSRYEIGLIRLERDLLIVDPRVSVFIQRILAEPQACAFTVNYDVPANVQRGLVPAQKFFFVGSSVSDLLLK